MAPCTATHLQWHIGGRQRHHAQREDGQLLTAAALLHRCAHSEASPRSSRAACAAAAAAAVPPLLPLLLLLLPVPGLPALRAAGARSPRLPVRRGGAWRGAGHRGAAGQGSAAGCRCQHCCEGAQIVRSVAVGNLEGPFAGFMRCLAGSAGEETITVLQRSRVMRTVGRVSIARPQSTSSTPTLSTCPCDPRGPPALCAALLQHLAALKGLLAIPRAGQGCTSAHCPWPCRAWSWQGSLPQPTLRLWDGRLSMRVPDWPPGPCSPAH